MAEPRRPMWARSAAIGMLSLSCFVLQAGGADAGETCIRESLSSAADAQRLDEWENISCLDLKRSTDGMDDKALQSLGKGMQKLHNLTILSLELSDDKSITLAGLESLARGLPEPLSELKLDLTYVNSVDDKVARSLGNKLQRLRQLKTLTLKLNNNINLTHVGLESLANGLPGALSELELDLNDVPNVGDKAMQSLSKGLRGLRQLKTLSLSLYSDHKVTRAGLESLARGLGSIPEGLKELTLDLRYAGTFSGQVLCKLANLAPGNFHVRTDLPVTFTTLEDMTCSGVDVGTNIIAALDEMNFSKVESLWKEAPASDRLQVMQTALGSTESAVQTWAHASVEPSDANDAQAFILAEKVMTSSQDLLGLGSAWKKARYSDAKQAVLAAVALGANKLACEMARSRQIDCSLVLEQAVRHSFKSGVMWAITECNKCFGYKLGKQVNIDSPIGNSSISEQRPALFIAALQEDVDMVDFLVETMHANVTSRTAVTRRTPLFASLGIDPQSNHANWTGARHWIFQFLLEKNAQVDSQDDLGQTPLCILAGGSKLYGTQKNSSMVDFLVKHGANPMLAAGCVNASEGSSSWKSLKRAKRDWQQKEINRWCWNSVQRLEICIVVAVVIAMAPFVCAQAAALFSTMAGSLRAQKSTCSGGPTGNTVTLVYGLRVRGHSDVSPSNGDQAAHLLKVFNKPLPVGTKLDVVDPLMLPKDVLTHFSTTGVWKSRPSEFRRGDFEFDAESQRTYKKPARPDEKMEVAPQMGIKEEVAPEDFLKMVGIAVLADASCDTCSCWEEVDTTFRAATDMTLVWIAPEPVGGVACTDPSQTRQPVEPLIGEPENASTEDTWMLYMIPSEATSEGLRKSGHGPMWMHFLSDFFDVSCFNLWAWSASKTLPPERAWIFFKFVIPISLFGFVLPFVSMLRVAIFACTSHSGMYCFERVRRSHANWELMFDLAQAYIIFLTQQVFEFKESDDFNAILLTYLNQLTTALDVVLLKGPEVLKGGFGSILKLAA
mmetsp:Transcript_84501/g.219931  ORF Transcript_84501/g.219931 Transcript_84501/m.219931 type:complete len:1008 (+) Transcript_84501:113-3136(+)